MALPGFRMGLYDFQGSYIFLLVPLGIFPDYGCEELTLRPSTQASSARLKSWACIEQVLQSC